MYPRISIITPSFNQGSYLEENILSVINQHYPNVEHIIIDGGSTDNTKEVIAKYRDKLAYVVSEADKGQSDAVNKGFAKATGEIIGWVNSDDYYEPGAFEIAAKAFLDQNINLVSGRTRLFNEDSSGKILEPTIHAGKDIQYHWRFPYINQPGMFFRKEAMDKIMPFNVLLHHVMDRELWIKYLMLFGLDRSKQVDEIIAHFRKHKDSKTTTSQKEFDNENASILYFFALKHNMKDVAEALAERYNLINEYTFNFNQIPDKESALQLIRYFFLKRACFVYQKNDFRYIKKMYPLLGFNNFNPLPEEEKNFKLISDAYNHINWLHFRLIRKYNHIFVHRTHS